MKASRMTCGGLKNRPSSERRSGAQGLGLRGSSGRQMQRPGKPAPSFLVMLIKRCLRISRPRKVLREGIYQLLLPVALELGHPKRCTAFDRHGFELVLPEQCQE